MLSKGSASPSTESNYKKKSMPLQARSKVIEYNIDVIPLQALPGLQFFHYC